MYYEYDSKCEVLIRMGEGKLPEICKKSDPEWKLLLSGSAENEQYARAVYLGQGCWERLRDVSEEEAILILKKWSNPML